MSKFNEDFSLKKEQRNPLKLSNLLEPLSSVMSMSICPDILRPDYLVKSIHTLGPQLTSSHLAASELMRRAKCDLAIKLHDSFENILQPKLNGKTTGTLILVPSAYAMASDFFMSEKTILVGCACIDTPPYHLAWLRGKKNPFLDKTREISIATHPAPVKLIKLILAGDVRYKPVYYNSTVHSAMAAIQEETCAALCNLNTINAYGMDYNPKGITINMTWNLFLVKGALDE